ncbi:MAG TPA: hypothetical protein PLJ60_11810 [Chryseolinea sp.]|nr:hypothetical protein [Chryseolinea sp.]HPM31009.1 hypothetical protein [Chryseolinea sp.]
MSPKAKQDKPRVKKPKPNLYGPNSPSRKKRVTVNPLDEDGEPIGSFYTKNDDNALEN